MVKNKPDGWVPPYRAYASPVESAEVTVAVIGVQAPDFGTARREAATITTLLEGATGLASSEACEVLQDSGAHHVVAVTYWRSRADLDAWWDTPAVARRVAGYLGTEVGVFREAFTAPRDHLEVNSSRPDADWGIGEATGWVEDERIGYWGACRDRIGAAEDHGLPGELTHVSPRDTVDATGRTVTITPPGNVCFIRTVQGWADADRDQQEFFLRGPYRAYMAGVEDLRSHPVATACLSARLLRHVAQGRTRPARETQAWFASLADMEQWVWHSATHGQIMATFTTFAERFGADIRLLLSHEVYVVPAGQATFTYVNCRTATGLLGYRDLAATATTPAGREVTSRAR